MRCHRMHADAAIVSQCDECFGRWVVVVAKPHNDMHAGWGIDDVHAITDVTVQGLDHRLSTGLQFFTCEPQMTLEATVFHEVGECRLLDA